LTEENNPNSLLNPTTFKIKVFMVEREKWR